MKISQDHPEFDKKVILLDGRVVLTALAADEEEGWVEIPDLFSLAPLPEDLESDEGFDTDFAPGGEEVAEWEEIKTIKKFGKVEIISLPT